MAKLIVELDGDCLCIHGDGFKNLMDGPCIFIQLDQQQITKVLAMQEAIDQTEKEMENENKG